MKKQVTKLYKVRDFELEKDTNERLRMCLLQPELMYYLKDNEMRKFDELYQTFALIHNARNLLIPESEVVKNALPDVSPKKAEQLVNDMKEVFEFGETKDLRKQIAAQMQWKLAEKAFNAATTPQDFDYASRILERATNLEGLHKIKEETERPKRKLPPRIILTSNPEVLIQQQERHGGQDDDGE